MARKTKKAAPKPFDREARDALRREPRTLFDPAGDLSSVDRKTRAALSRRERRHGFAMNEGTSRNPLRPNIRWERVPREERTAGLMASASLAELDLARAAL